MNTLQKIKKTLRQLFGLNTPGGIDYEIDYLWGPYGNQSSSGIYITPETSLHIAPVFRAVNLIAGDIAKLPLQVFRRVDGGKEPDLMHSATKLLKIKPNQYITPFTFKHCLVAQMLLRGNGYAYIEKQGARNVSLVALDSSRVTPFKKDGDLYYEYTYNDGTKKNLFDFQVLHLKLLTTLDSSGILGKGIIDCARDSLGLTKALETYGSKFFSNSAEPSMAIEYPGRLDHNELKELLQGWARRHQGPDNYHKVGVLQDGMTIKPISITAEEAQLLESRKFQLREIANFFGISAYRLGGDQTTSYNSLEMENQNYLDNLDPILVSMEEELERKLLTERQLNGDTHLIEFDRTQLIRVDLKTKTESVTAIYQAGLVTGNEARERLGYNPQDGMDEVLIPTNMMGGVATEDDAQDLEEEPVEAPPQDRSDTLREELLNTAITRITRAVSREAKKNTDFIDYLNNLEAKHALVIEPRLKSISASLGQNPSEVIGSFFDQIRECYLVSAEVLPDQLAKNVQSTSQHLERHFAKEFLQQWKLDT